MNSFPDKNKIIKMVLILFGIIAVTALLSKLHQKNSMTLSDYAKLRGDEIASETPASKESGIADPEPSAETSGENASYVTDESASSESSSVPKASLIGETLNGDSMTAERYTFHDGFYCEPLSQNLRRYITGISYTAESVFPDADSYTSDSSETAVRSDDTPDGFSLSGQPMLLPAFDDLSYLHILYKGIDGNTAAGELICHRDLSVILLDIFYHLYQNEYRLGPVCLPECYDGNPEQALSDNACFCFYAGKITGSNSKDNFSGDASKKKFPEDGSLPDDFTADLAAGRAVLINPLYNPMLCFTQAENSDVSEPSFRQIVYPENAEAYADRTLTFPYKIDESDYCYRLFTEYGFVWGGNRNNPRNYALFRLP